MDMDMALMYPQYLRNHKQYYPKLTEKETAVLKLLAENKSIMEIADFLDNSVNTVKHHLKNIYRKLGVNCREDAIAIAKEEIIIMKK